ncbi:tRNA (adenosine(37)-N6)-dimethylallyltransferase MiaA [bacterium]|nr:tRNA (adenosine(37)-N6)-dimethylallyltransferase MiaA [bacterium]
MGILNRKKSLVICGPTAVGKTEIAEIIARKLDGEIISADSRQIYKKLDIGTAKPLGSPVRHHLLNIIEPTEIFDSMKFVQLALDVMKQITESGKLPIIVGGTGLYIRALTVGIFTGDFNDDGVRAELQRRWDNGENLYDELKKIDPIAAAKIDPNNYVRIERAIEIFITSGKPISYWWKQETHPPSDWEFFKIVLSMDRDILYRRIEERTRKMFDFGWLDEVENLLDSGIEPNCRGLSSIGYRQIVKYILGEFSYDEMFEQIVRETRHYAKRQITWFKKEPNSRWLDIEGFKPDECAEKIIALFLGK